MAHSMHFWNFIAKHYAKQSVPDARVYQNKLTITQRFLRPDMNVFELACGTGSTALHHAPVVKHYRAIDVSEKMIGIAQQKQQQTQIDNLCFQQSSFESYPIAEASQDAVLAMSILHLLEDPKSATEKVQKILHQGGYFIISSVCLKDRYYFMRWFSPWLSALGLLPKLQYFSETELKAWLGQSGFTIEYELEDLGNTDACFIIAKKI